jgi:hypothetical protein
MTDKELGALRDNAVRLASDNGPRRAAAERLLPLIDSELEERRARPSPARPPSPAKRVARKAVKAK